MWSQAAGEKGENLGEEEVGWKEKERSGRATKAFKTCEKSAVL